MFNLDHDLQEDIDRVQKNIESMDKKLKLSEEALSKATTNIYPVITGCHFYVHLRYPRSDNEHRSLINQIQGFSEHFPKLIQLVRVLRPNINNDKSNWEIATKKWITNKEGYLHRPV